MQSERLLLKGSDIFFDNVLNAFGIVFGKGRFYDVGIF